jgi:peptidoglycan/xylan/chitin deacetylase (PgdA/CDA1 family)
MQSILTIVMYHYVRDLRRSRHSAIKALSLQEFEEQIQYITRYYSVISGPELMDAIAEAAPLPPRPILLTFDDGYLDHFTEVFPVLDRQKLPGCFFPPAKCILEHEVLDVNKIHFVLSSAPDKRTLLEPIFAQIDENRSRYPLLSSAEYWAKLGKPSRFDPAEVAFFKRMLQRELPLPLRRAILDELFRRHVTADEESFSRELYMTLDQLRLLRRHGMYIGSHGYDHLWLDTLSPPQQEREIDQSLRFLTSVGGDARRWIMCYPYGAHNESLLSVLKSRNCVVGLTTEVGLASLDGHDPLLLPRLDTNDLPKCSDAELDEWTVQAGARAVPSSG